MKKIFLLLTLSAMLFSCSTNDNELIMPNDSEKLYVNPDGSNVMAAVGTPIYAKLINSSTVHFFWDPQFTMRAVLTYDIVLRYAIRPSGIIHILDTFNTYARVVSAGTSSLELPRITKNRMYVLSGVEEFTGTLVQGGLFQQVVNGRMNFYTNSSLTQQAYLVDNVTVRYGILKTTTTDMGTTTELINISEWIIPQWCESFELPRLIYASNPNEIVTQEYIILSCVWGSRIQPF